MEAKILELLMMYQFAKLSSDEEKELNLLLDKDKVDRQMYLELKEDRDKLIDFIIKRVNSTENEVEFDKERAKARFFDAIKSFL